MSNPNWSQGNSIDPLAGESSPRVQQIREFLGSLKERSPQEAMGINDQGMLFSSVIVSSLGFVALVAVLTAIPHFMPRDEKKLSKKPAPATRETSAGDAAKPLPSAPSAGQPAAGSAAATAKSPAAAAAPKGVANPDRVLNNLGIGESKAAPADKNPLDKVEGLLDGID